MNSKITASFLRAIGILTIMSATFVATALQAKPLAPCDGAFQIAMKIEPADGYFSNSAVASDAIGVELNYGVAADPVSHKRTYGMATRTHTQQVSIFDKSQCEHWQKTVWPHFSKVLFENKRPERASIVCQNIATLTYAGFGFKSKTQKLCLTHVDADGLSYGFRKFYDGTDLLVGR